VLGNGDYHGEREQKQRLHERDSEPGVEAMQVVDPQNRHKLHKLGRLDHRLLRLLILQHRLKRRRSGHLDAGLRNIPEGPRQLSDAAGQSVLQAFVGVIVSCYPQRNIIGKVSEPAKISRLGNMGGGNDTMNIPLYPPIAFENLSINKSESCNAV
jgi:hypothetical protein